MYYDAIHTMVPYRYLRSQPPGRRRKRKKEDEKVSDRCSKICEPNNRFGEQEGRQQRTVLILAVASSDGAMPADDAAAPMCSFCCN